MRYQPNRPFPETAYRLGGGARPEVSRRTPARPEDEWFCDTDYRFSVDLYNHAYFWEAHELWEQMWKRAEPGGCSRLVLQALIQCAAINLHAASRADTYRAGTGRDALVQRVEDRLTRARAQTRYCLGLDLDRLLDEFRQFAGAPARHRPPPLELTARSRDLPASLTDRRIRDDAELTDCADGLLVNAADRPGFPPVPALYLDAAPVTVQPPPRSGTTALRAVVWETSSEIPTACATDTDQYEQLRVLVAHPGTTSADAPDSAAEAIQLPTGITCSFHATDDERWGAVTAEGGGTELGRVLLFHTPTLCRVLPPQPEPTWRDQPVGAGLVTRAIAHLRQLRPHADIVIVANGDAASGDPVARLNRTAAGSQHRLWQPATDRLE